LKEHNTIPLLELALDAHGGLTRWRQVKSIDLKLSIGGPLWHAKGLPQGLNVALRVEPSRKLVIVSPFDGEDSTGYFTPDDLVWVENGAETYLAAWRFFRSRPAIGSQCAGSIHNPIKAARIPRES
jgi:hypothetical protein